MANILVVDDESDMQLLIRQKFRRQIADNTYQFAFAQNGLEALNYLSENHEVDMVLSDINMPQLDGLSMLVKLKEIKPLTKVVMISAYGDMDNIRAAMNRGAFDFICKPIDFQDLQVTIDKTLEQVKHLQGTMKAIRENNILKLYVDGNVLNFMTKAEFETVVKQNEVIEATVAFIDICGFTAIAEQETPDNIVHLLNHYFDVIVNVILEENGYVDKFMGDAVMAIFKGDQHLVRALQAAIKIREKIASLKDPLPGNLTYFPKVAIGINGGEMVSGNIGSVNSRRLDYTVIGDAVNLAQRLQALASPSQILITEKSYQQIKDQFDCQLIGPIQVKNKQNSVILYEVQREIAS